MSIIISMSNSGAKLINADQQAVAIVSDALSYDEEGAKFTAAYKMGQWNGKKTFLKFPGLLFQAGFVPLVRQALAEAGYAITINDVRERVEITADDIAIEGFEPYDFQLEAVSVLEREVRGIVQAATGAGKTEIGIMATKRFGLPTLFLTHKLDLVRQTRNRFHQRLGRPVGMISEGEWLPADITVATIQTILSNWTKIWEIRGLDRSNAPAIGQARGPTESEAAKYAKKTLKWKRVDSTKMIEDRAAKVDVYLRSVRFLIVDEAHRASGDTFFRIIGACVNAYWRLSLTATPLMKGNREDDLKLIASSGNVIYRVTNGQLIARGILAEPHFSFVEVPAFVMSDGRKPYRHEYPAVYREGIVQNSLRNSLVVEETLALVQEGRQTVVLVKHIEHGKTLERLFAAAGAKALWLSGSDDGDERERGLNKLRTGEINILIASTILDEGLDCDAIAGIVLAGGEKSKISLFQRVGRSVRAKKGDILERLGNTAKVVDFIDTGDPRLMKHSATRYKAVKDEEGWVIDGIKRYGLAIAAE